MQGSRAICVRDEKELASKLGLRLVPGTNNAEPIRQSSPATSRSVCPSLGQSTLGQLVQKGQGQWAKIEATEKHMTALRWDFAETLEKIKALCGDDKRAWTNAYKQIGIDRRRVSELLGYRKIFKTRDEAAKTSIDTANRMIRKARTGTSKSRNDYTTPAHALDILLPYLPTGKVIWEAAWGTGQLAGHLSKAGYHVVGNRDMNFLRQTPNKWDIIVTNPPYSQKDEFLQRAYVLGRPFALLLPLTALEGKARHQMYRRHGISVIIPDKYINYESEHLRHDHCPFSTAWFCWMLKLPAQLNFVEATW